MYNGTLLLPRLLNSDNFIIVVEAPPLNPTFRIYKYTTLKIVVLVERSTTHGPQTHVEYTSHARRFPSKTVPDVTSTHLPLSDRDLFPSSALV